MRTVVRELPVALKRRDTTDPVDPCAKSLFGNQLTFVVFLIGAASFFFVFPTGFYTSEWERPFWAVVAIVILLIAIRLIFPGITRGVLVNESSVVWWRGLRSTRISRQEPVTVQLHHVYRNHPYMRTWHDRVLVISDDAGRSTIVLPQSRYGAKGLTKIVAALEIPVGVSAARHPDHSAGHNAQWPSVQPRADELTDLLEPPVVPTANADLQPTASLRELPISWRNPLLARRILGWGAVLIAVLCGSFFVYVMYQFTIKW